MFSISTLGGIKSGLLSGEGFVMNFHGPCEVLVQNKNFNNLAYKVINLMKNKKII